MLSRFIDAGLVELYNPWDEVAGGDDAGMLEALKRWLTGAVGDTFLVMASCYELCDPREIMRGSPTDLAHVARIFMEDNHG